MIRVHQFCHWHSTFVVCDSFLTCKCRMSVKKNDVYGSNSNYRLLDLDVGKRKSDPSNGLPQRIIEGSSGGDDLWEASSTRELTTKLGSGAHIWDSMKRLRPPLIAFDPEPGNRAGGVHEQVNLFLQRQPSNEVLHPLLYRQWHLAKWQALCGAIFRVTSERVTGFSGVPENS